MALRIVDEGNFPTLGGMAFKDQYPGDYSGDVAGLPAARDYTTEQIFANSPMMERERKQAEFERIFGQGGQTGQRSQRYEDQAPFKAQFWGRKKSADAQYGDYLARAQQYNAQQDDQAQKDLQMDLNIMTAMKKAPPGQRDPIIKLYQRYNQQRGIALDPELLKFYKKADEDDWAAAQWAGQEFLKSHPDVDQAGANKVINSNPAALSEVLSLIAQAKENKLKNEQTELENQLWKQTGEAFSRTPTEAPTRPQEPFQTPPVQAPSLQLQQAPGGPQEASRPSQRGVAFNQMVDTIGDRMGATPQVRQMVKASLAMETSNYDLTATSPKGAQGIGQFMPATAQQYGVQDPNNPGQAIMGMVKYYTDLEKMFPGKPDLQFASYNAGQGAVQQAGNKVPNYPETQGYVQKGMQYLQGLPKPHSESVAQAPGQVQESVKFYDQKINELQATLDRLPPGAAMIPKIRGVIEQLQKRQEFYMKRQETIEKRYDEKPAEPLLTASNKLFPGTPWSMLTKEQKQAAGMFADTEGTRLAGERAGATAKATQSYDLERAKAGNMGNIPGPDTILKYRNTTGKGPLRPSNLTNSERAAENNEAVEAGGQEKWVIERPLEAKTEDELNLKLSAVDSTKRVMEYLDDPKIAGFVGTLLSNPTAGFAKAVADVWGGTVPEKYRETAAEIANLTSTILNDRIGSAQTATEFKRLGPLIKDMSAVDSGTLKASMRIIHNAMAIDFNRRYRGLVGRGYEVLPDWKEVKPLETTMDREKREAAETQTPDKTPSATRLNPFQEAARKDRERREGKP